MELLVWHMYMWVWIKHVTAGICQHFNSLSSFEHTEQAWVGSPSLGDKKYKTSLLSGCLYTYQSAQCLVPINHISFEKSVLYILNFTHERSLRRIKTKEKLPSPFLCLKKKKRTLRMLCYITVNLWLTVHFSLQMTV